MAIVKNNYIKHDGREKAKAKATIRYIQHRQGKTAGNHMTHATHSHCCALADISNPEQLWYKQTYHDLHCKIYSPEYWLRYYTGRGWPASSRTRNKTPQKNTLVNTPEASGDSKAGTTPGKEKEHSTRTLFGRDGAMGRYEAYRMIDEAEKGSVYFRFIISPDSNTEDTNRDLRLRDVTAHTMLSFEEHIKQQVQWVAAEHADHTPLRHVHIVAVVPARLERQEFQALPQVLRRAATNTCWEQRQELDLTLEHHTQAGEEAAWELSH
jgi:hypothetical protein